MFNLFQNPSQNQSIPLNKVNMDVVISFPILKKNRLKEGLGRAVVEEAAAGYKRIESLVLWVMKSSSPGGCRVEL
jgi:hypothetical protein